MKQQPETIGDLILLHVEKHYGTQAAAAIAWQCSTTFLNQVVRGERRPNERMLLGVGYRHIELWVPQSQKLPDAALPMAKGL